MRLLQPESFILLVTLARCLRSHCYPALVLFSVWPNSGQSPKCSCFVYLAPISICIYAIRPEKDHRAQLNIFHRLLELHPEYIQDAEEPVRLVLVGGSRNEGDAQRILELRRLAKELRIDVSGTICADRYALKYLFHRRTSTLSLTHRILLCSIGCRRPA